MVMAVRALSIALVLLLAVPSATRAAAALDKGELIVVDATAPPTSLDPFKVYGTQAQSLFRLIYAPLVDRDVDGKIVTPLLEHWGQVDALTWEFRLRPGVRFHDGRELTAADVAYSLQRIVNPEVASPRSRDFAELDRITALDQRTIHITTKRPYALLPARLSQFSMVLPDRLRGRPEAQFFARPIGLGPFRLEAINADQAILSAFQGYSGGGPAKVPRVVFQFVSDRGERLRRLLEGPASIVTNLPPQHVEAVMRARHTRLLKRSSIRLMDIMIDATKGPLAQKEVRQALRYAMDVENLIKYVARGNGRPLATWALPEDFGFNPQLRPYPFNPAKAMSLLSQAGYARGFRLRGLATHDTQTVATAVAQQWAKVGVMLEITTEGRTQATQRWIRERGQHDFWFLDPTSIIFDASYLLRLHTDPGHPIARAPHPRVFELLNRSDGERNPDVRAALLREAQILVHEEALAMPLYQVIDLYGAHSQVRGFTPSVDTILRLMDVRLAQ